MKIELVL